jgi:hypothetical protein
MIEVKSFRTFIRKYSLFKSERLSSNIKLPSTKHSLGVSWPIMTYACPALEFAADNHLLKLQSLQNKVFRTIGNFPRRTWLSNLRIYTIWSKASGRLLETAIQLSLWHTSQSWILYRVGPPFAFMTARTLPGRLSTRCLNVSGGMAAHSSCRAVA